MCQCGFYTYIKPPKYASGGLGKSLQVLFGHYQPETITVYIHYFHAAVFLQVLTQFCYIYVHTTTVEVSIATPYSFQGSITRQQVIFIFTKHQQQLIL